MPCHQAAICASAASPVCPCRTSQQADHGARTADAAPAVQVHHPAVPQGGIDGVEDPGHGLPRSWDVSIDDRIPRMPHRRAQGQRFLCRARGVGLQTLMHRGEVDEVVDPRAQQGP